MAVAKALEEYPGIIAQWDNGSIRSADGINLGMAIAVDDELIVPVIKNANKLTLSEIASRCNNLVKKAKENNLDQNDLTGGVFTVSNLGMYGIDVFTPILNPPESAILGVGRIVDKPKWENGQVRNSSMVWLSLTSDHQVINGASSASFIKRLSELIGKPYMLMAK
jgi:pyruvate dehydrogenase E2 component (dihydrolipoamide acetyltransferase)